MDLMYPHLLSNEQLVGLLIGFNIRDLNTLTRDKLITLYEKYVMPKPQRKQHKARENDQQSSSTTFRETGRLENRVKSIRLVEYDDKYRPPPKIVRVNPPATSSMKRKIEPMEISSEADAQPKKRQKITWP